MDLCFPYLDAQKIATLFASFAVLVALVAYGYLGSRKTLDYDKRGKFLCLAIATYEQRTGHLPHDIGGLSWRVELLRSDGAIEDLALFQHFHLDEPWDSPHNKGLIEKIPWWLQDPDGERGYTCYRGVSGKNCAFDHGATVKAIPSGDPSPTCRRNGQRALPLDKASGRYRGGSREGRLPSLVHRRLFHRKGQVRRFVHYRARLRR